MDKAVTSELLDPVERQLVSNDLIAYQAGRGSHHAVSTLIPKDTVEGLKMIASENVRMQAGVEKENDCLLPHCQGSMDHAIHCISTLARVAEPKHLTAAKIRHHPSTIYAQLDLSENDKQLFCLCVI